MVQWLGQKGQEAMPFELLVAVIIMGFVIFIGFFALQNVQFQQCINLNDSTLNKMRLAIETVAAEGTPQWINFTLDRRCFNEEDEEIKLMDFDEPAFCAEYCGGASRKLCTLLQYYYKGEESISSRKCLQVSSDIYFPDTIGDCPDMTSEGYELVGNFREGIVQGNYLLIRKGVEPFTKICAYLKKG